MYGRVKTPDELRELIKSGQKTFYLTNCSGHLPKNSKCQIRIDKVFPSHFEVYEIAPKLNYDRLSFTYVFNNKEDKMRLFTNYWGALAFDLKHRHSERNKEPA